MAAFGELAFGEPVRSDVIIGVATGVAATGSAGSPSKALTTRAISGVRATGIGGTTLLIGQALAGGVEGVGTVAGAFLSDTGVLLTAAGAHGHAGDVEIIIGIPVGLFGLSGHIRRDGDTYGQALANLLPQGLAWPREATSVLMRCLAGLSQVWGKPVDSRAADLLENESDPRSTFELLPDWERAWGLPDKCLAEPQTVGDRQIALVTKMTLLGAQSRLFFWKLAKRIGHRIYVIEYSPFMAGVSRAGDTRPGPEGGWEEGHYRWEIGRPEIRFYWKVKVVGRKFTWFRASRGESGVDPHVRIGLATDLECILRRYKPAHSDIIFDYSLSTDSESGAPNQ
jgi:uncharacterized protein YmfQ (DUF2313 family)